MGDDRKHEEATSAPAEATTAEQGAAPQPASGAGILLGLQNSAGNQATNASIQPKLSVGPAGDRYEQEADRVASAVMRNLQRRPIEPSDDEDRLRAGTSQPIRPHAVDHKIQPKAAEPMIGSEGGALDANTDAAIRRAKGTGKPLDDGLRASMEGGFGVDFSTVRVHDDAGADHLNQKIQAKAFTTGSDIFFRSGDYNPGTTAGQELVAHELTHVVQQGGAGVARTSIQRDADGRTGGKVTLTDFKGGDVSNVDKTKANLAESVNQKAVMADMATRVATGESRTEDEMLAAIAADTVPRYIARVGPKEDFTKYKSFGKGWSEFIFATEPADLAGLHPAVAMSKVGWTKEWIAKAAGKPIAVCIFDTHEAVPDKADANATATVGVGKLEWPELKAKALVDTRFTVAASAAGISDPGACFDIWQKTPVGGDPRTTDATLKEDSNKLRGVLDAIYGANELYSGMGATIREDGSLGAREVMITNRGTGFALTPDNHVLVDTTPNKYTEDDANAL
ncbi:MAG: DUF4157 domain-containing protein [Acidimicrobiia bacterium]|nr:DUF4157 domain-containing protein [Acidimicrobiia bacterium]